MFIVHPIVENIILSVIDKERGNLKIIKKQYKNKDNLLRDNGINNLTDFLSQEFYKTIDIYLNKTNDFC